MLTKQQINTIDFIYDCPLKIAHAVGFNLLTDLHAGHIRELVFGTEDRTDLWHRGSYKTTDVSISFALYMLLFPNKNIIFMRKTDTDVSEVITQVAKILKSDYLQGLSYQLYGRGFELIKENKSEIITDLFDSNRGVSQLLGLGTGASLTGKHADWIHTDDIVNLKDRISRAEREHTKLVYQELQNIKNRCGRITNTGTKWHKEDAVEMMPNVHIIDCYTSGLISKEQLEKIRKSMSPTLFAANYELKHIADENALFKDAPKFFDDISLLYNGIGHIDASYGGEDGSAFSLGRKIGNNIYIYGKLKNKHIDQCINEYIELTKFCKCGTIWCEDNGDKGYLARDIMKKHPAQTYHESTNKYIKISSYLRNEWDNIYFYKNTDAEYLQQILDYTEDAGHDDAPDSASSIVRKLCGNNIRYGF